MDYKRVLKLHFENGYSGRTIAKNTGAGQRTAVNDFLKRFKECEQLYRFRIERAICTEF